MRAGDTRSAGHVSAMSQCVGHLVAAVGPVLFGLPKDYSGSWRSGLVACLIIVVLMTTTGVASSRGGEVHPR